MVTRLRYIGVVPTNFAEPRIGMKEFGDEFGVMNDQADAYTRRSDIEVLGVDPDETDPVEDPDPAPEVPESPAEDAPAEPEPETPAEPAPAASEPDAAPEAPAAE